jgi:uncharacterized hydrophobic protein (TIGR00271 family)
MSEELTKREVIENLIESSHADKDYYLMVMVSAVISTIGLLLGDVVIIIGGMLISPLLAPLLALALGVITTNQSSLQRSISAVGRSIVLVLGLAIVTTWILGVETDYNDQILSRVEPHVYYVYISILSGLAATYAWVKPRVSETLPGIAISIALIPPLCVVGIGLATFDREIIGGALQLFLLNTAGIVASSVFVFSLKGFHVAKKIEEQEILAETLEEVENSK